MLETIRKSDQKCELSNPIEGTNIASFVEFNFIVCFLQMKAFGKRFSVILYLKNKKENSCCHSSPKIQYMDILIYLETSVEGDMNGYVGWSVLEQKISYDTKYTLKTEKMYSFLWRGNS